MDLLIQHLEELGFQLHQAVYLYEHWKNEDICPGGVIICRKENFPMASVGDNFDEWVTEKEAIARLRGMVAGA